MHKAMLEEYRNRLRVPLHDLTNGHVFGNRHLKPTSFLG